MVWTILVILIVIFSAIIGYIFGYCAGFAAGRHRKLVIPLYVVERDGYLELCTLKLDNSDPREIRADD